MTTRSATPSGRSTKPGRRSGSSRSLTDIAGNPEPHASGQFHLDRTDGRPPVQPSADRVKEEVKLENLADVPLIISHTMRRIRPNESARLGMAQHIALKIDAVRSIVDQVERGYWLSQTRLHHRVRGAIKIGKQKERFRHCSLRGCSYCSRKPAKMTSTG